MITNNHIYVRLGGSYRKYKKQKDAFEAAKIPITFCYNTGHHYKYSLFWMPDTTEAREILKKVGGTIPREKKNKDEATNLQPGMF